MFLSWQEGFRDLYRGDSFMYLVSEKRIRSYKRAV
jgi:hypothetical protein